MLDAAHGEAVGAVVRIQRIHVVCPEVQAAYVVVTGKIGR